MPVSRSMLSAAGIPLTSVGVRIITVVLATAPHSVSPHLATFVPLLHDGRLHGLDPHGPQIETFKQAGIYGIYVDGASHIPLLRETIMTHFSSPSIDTKGATESGLHLSTRLQGVFHD